MSRRPHLTAQMQRSAAKMRMARTRWFIQFTVRRLVDDHRYKPHDWRRFRHRAVWPKLFTTEAAARAVLEEHAVFQNAATIPGVRGRLISCTIEKKVLLT